MRSSMAMLGAMGFVLAGGSAALADVLDGTVDMIDEEAKMITVDGEDFMLDATHELTDVDIGEKVTVTYEEKDGHKMVQSMTDS